MIPPVAYLNARLVDPATGLDAPGGLLTEGKVIADLGPRLFNEGVPDGIATVDCKGAVLCPGLVDARVFTGEPGAEHKETIRSASKAAAAGGVTTMIVMPNTNPVIDEVALVDYIERRARDTALVHVHPMAALTRGLKGTEMTEMGLLKDAGAVAFTDGDRAVANALVLRRALSYARTFDALVVEHAQEPALSGGGAMNEGELAMRLGLTGIPKLAETMMVERDIRLVELTGARLHISQVSCVETLDVIRAAKARGLPITCGVSAHHLALNENDVGAYRTFVKVSPPLCGEDDRRALIEAVLDGTIDIIVSSHDPQAPENKRLPFGEAAFGAIGLETLLSVVLSLHNTYGASLCAALKPVTITPAALLKLPAGRLAKGAPADFILADPGYPYIVEGDKLRSRTKNTPFDGLKLQGVALRTVVSGLIVNERTPDAG